MIEFLLSAPVTPHVRNTELEAGSDKSKLQEDCGVKSFAQAESSLASHTDLAGSSGQVILVTEAQEEEKYILDTARSEKHSQLTFEDSPICSTSALEETISVTEIADRNKKQEGVAESIPHRGRMSPEERSHYLLETLLYRVQLHSHIGMHMTAVKILQVNRCAIA